MFIPYYSKELPLSRCLLSGFFLLLLLAAVFSAAAPAGLFAGRRFLPGKNRYAEPAFRASYPFIIGAGGTGGFRF
jgi:hypothetical protein